ncbi:hypothetical protein, partial [Escherichia coli]|uniref:hypothetical protein n=1 Tax=Escherichia coli TaxID=562 RepID=UPI001BE3DA0A
PRSDWYQPKLRGTSATPMIVQMRFMRTGNRNCRLPGRLAARRNPPQRWKETAGDAFGSSAPRRHSAACFIPASSAALTFGGDIGRL